METKSWKKYPKKRKLWKEIDNYDKNNISEAILFENKIKLRNIFEKVNLQNNFEKIKGWNPEKTRKVKEPIKVRRKKPVRKRIWFGLTLDTEAGLNGGEALW